MSRTETAFTPFAVEQYLSETEHGVHYNFSESGVHPLSYSELFELCEIDTEALFASLVDYPQVNGRERLREHIAGLYPGAAADNVLVTVGATEANTLVASTLLEAGDNIVRFTPTYEQLAGNAYNLGFEVRSVDLVEDEHWSIDRAGLAAAADEHTRIIHVVNPNNPTGVVMSDSDRKLLVETAAQYGAWIVVDEVYAGTERNTDTATSSFWGDYDRVIAINSMSKAYGMPGLRLGWLVAPSEWVAPLWRRHEYASITATMMSNLLAEQALDPRYRPAITARARGLIRRGFSTLEGALAHHQGVFSVVPPDASAMSFVRFDLPLSSEELAARLLKEEDVLVVPGSRFGVDGHFRFSSALPEAHLIQGLERLNHLVGRVLDGK